MEDIQVSACWGAVNFEVQVGWMVLGKDVCQVCG